MRKYLQVGWLLTDYEGLISWVGIWGWAYSFPWNLHDMGVLWFQVSISCSHSSISFMAGKVLASVFAQVSSPFHWWPCFFSSTGVCHVQIRRRRCANQHHTACAESGGAGGLWLEVWQLQTSSIAKSYWKQVTTESQQKKWYKKTIENGKNYIVGLVLEQWRDPLRIFWVITGVRNELVLTPNVPIRHHGPL